MLIINQYKNQTKMKTTILIIAVSLVMISCTHKETEAERLEREYQLSKIKTEKVIDSIDLELIKLGVNEKK